jgi:hypothetical protein
MNWKPNFYFLNYSFFSPYQNKQNSWTYNLHEHGKIYVKGKKWGEVHKGKSCGAFLCIHSSLMIQQQQIHP